MEGLTDFEKALCKTIFENNNYEYRVIEYFYLCTKSFDKTMFLLQELYKPLIIPIV